jgi:hypothetical protein
MVMIKREIAPGIVVYSDVYERYSEIINNIEDSVMSGVVAWAGALVKTAEGIEVKTESRDTQIIGIPYHSNFEIYTDTFLSEFNLSVSEMLFNIVDPAEKDYLNMYGISFNDHEQYSLLKYGEGQKFINHIDDYKEGPRRISLVYYINEDYVGGEIKFPRFGITYKPKANDLIIFPSTYVYNHSVNPVISGTRYAVASWIN